MAGSPHIHALLWIKDAPSLTTHEDVANDELVCDYVSKHVSTSSTLVKEITGQEHKDNAERIVLAFSLIFTLR
jgi:hypothetical protein